MSVSISGFAYFIKHFSYLVLLSERSGHIPLFSVVLIIMNEQNLKPINSVSVAREMQKKSAEKRRQNTAENKLIRERILERMGESDWDTMIDNLIERASNDTKSFEVLRDTIGQKPVEQLELSGRKQAQNKLDEMLNQL